MSFRVNQRHQQMPYLNRGLVFHSSPDGPSSSCSTLEPNDTTEKVLSLSSFLPVVVYMEIEVRYDQSP